MSKVLHAQSGIFHCSALCCDISGWFSLELRLGGGYLNVIQFVLDL